MSSVKPELERLAEAARPNPDTALASIMQRAERRMRRRRLVAIAVAASVSCLSIAWLIAAFTGQPAVRNVADSPTAVSSVSVTPTPAPPRDAGSNPVFVPPIANRTPESSELRVVFPDGERTVVAYPSDLELADLGVTPGFTAFLQGSCGNDAIVRYGDVTTPIFSDDGFVASVPSRAYQASLWEGGGGFSELYLRIVIQDWTVGIPCGRDVERALASATEWVDLLHLAYVEGYLVVGATAPLTLAHDEAYGPTLIFGTGSTGYLVITHADSSCGRTIDEPTGYGERCFPSSAGGSFFATAEFPDKNYQRRLMEGLRVVSEEEA